jgi:hypothetical protein
MGSPNEAMLAIFDGQPGAARAIRYAAAIRQAVPQGRA